MRTGAREIKDNNGETGQETHTWDLGKPVDLDIHLHAQSTALEGREEIRTH